MMDPMDYILHTNPRSSTVQYDPVHAASGSWSSPPLHQPSPAFPWHSHAPPQIHHILPVPPDPRLDPFQVSSHVGLPPPFSGFHNIPNANGFSGPMPRSYHTMPYELTQMSSRPGIHAPAVPAEAFSHQIPPGPGLNFQSPGGLNVHTRGSASEPNNPLPRPPLSMSDSPANGFAQPHNNPPLAIHLPGPENILRSPPLRGSIHSSSSHGHRLSREGPSPTRTSQSGSVYRRPHPRARRSASRATYFESMADDEELRRHIWRSDGTMDPEIEEALFRQAQLLQGLPTKMIASKTALRSLQSVNIDDLEGEDKICVICYNELGTETPEGIKEAALRLPKCKHVFGDYCIKKWFENSDNCPYCRDKVPSEPKNSITARSFLNLMRARGLHPEAYEAGNALLQASAMGAPAPLTSGNRLNSTGGRRSPPDDAGEQQRRTRPRHSNSTGRDSGSRRSFTMGYDSPVSPASASTPTAPQSTATSIPPTPQRASAARASSSTQRRRNGALEGMTTINSSTLPTTTTAEVSRRSGLPPSQTSMSPSAPVFHPRGAALDSVNDGLFPSSASTISTNPFMDNRIPLPIDVVQGGQSQQEGTPPVVGSQASPNQDMNRSRPW